MNALFVRVSVFFEGRQLDVSLPAQRPTVDIIDDIVALLSQHPQQVDGDNPGLTVPEAHTWVLSSPTVGIIEPHLSLADRGVADGERLYLTSRHEAAHSPFVDDAITEVRSTIGENQWRWTAQTRSSGIFAVVSALAVVFMVAAGLSLRRSAELLGNSTLVYGVTVACSALVLVVLGALRPHAWMRWLGVALPVATFFIVARLTADLPAEVGVPAMVAVVSLSGCIAAMIAGRGAPAGATAGVVACAIVASVSAVVSVLCAFGANFYAVNAWSAWVPVLVLLVAPTLAINSTGLATLLRINDAGEQVERSAIRAKALRSEAVSRGIVWAATALALGMIFSLASSPYWQHGIIAALLCPVVLLRTNGFADTRVIFVLLSTGLIGVAVLAGSFTAWGIRGWAAESHRIWFMPGSDTGIWPWIAAGAVFALAVLVLLLLHRREPDELAEARLVQVLSPLDVVVCLATIPVILAAQGVFTYYWATT